MDLAVDEKDRENVNGPPGRTQRRSTECLTRGPAQSESGASPRLATASQDRIGVGAACAAARVCAASAGADPAVRHVSGPLILPEYGTGAVTLMLSDTLGVGAASSALIASAVNV